MKKLSIALALAALAACTQTVIKEEIDPSLRPGGNGTQTQDEILKPLRADWKDRVATYLDGRAKEWLATPPPIANVKCAMSCHTTVPTVFAQAAFAGQVEIPAAAMARTRIETRVSEAKAGTIVPYYGKSGDAKTVESHATESVLNAASLALLDVSAGGDLSPATKTALDRMWAQQSADGSWKWLEFGLEPWETRNDWGTALAALVAGSIPADSTAGQAAGVGKLKTYLNGRIGSMALHDKIAVLWASGAMPDLIDDGKRETIATALLATQLEDGGFSLGAWGKGDEAASVKSTSDGYATGYAVLALVRGLADGANREETKKALSWLANNQTDDGSWPGQSVNSTSARAAGFMTDAATAYATLALTSYIAKTAKPAQ